MSNYLEKFPARHRQFIHNRFTQAYVFPEQSYEFGEDDVIDLAVGPVTMKARVVAACEELLPLVDEERQQVLAQVIETIDESDDLLVEVKTKIDVTWAAAREYEKLHPRKDRKPQEPATPAQKKFLKQLGCLEEPKSKADASRLIEKHKKK